MRPLKPPEDPLGPTQVFVVVVSLATVALWCCSNLLAPVTGEMGVLAILPLGEGGGGGGVVMVVVMEVGVVGVGVKVVAVVGVGAVVCDATGVGL